MQFIGLRKDKDTKEIIKYELKLYKQNINCIYKDKYGVYICTHGSHMYKVDHSIDYIIKEFNL